MSPPKLPTNMRGCFEHVLGAASKNWRCNAASAVPEGSFKGAIAAMSTRTLAMIAAKTYINTHPSLRAV